MKTILCILVFAVSIASSFHVAEFDVSEFDVPKGFPDVDHPIDNELTQARWDLGKTLFYDPILSADSTVSCSSCHAPDLAFSDSVALSLGVNQAPGAQNAPSLANVAYHPYFTRAGGVPTLEMQILVPIQEHVELNSNIVDIAERMSLSDKYVHMSMAAYNRRPDAFVITRALACFERTLISGNSAYDRFAHYGEHDALSDLERAGMELFFSDRAQCSSCHSGFNFTDYTFQNNGLYMVYPDSGRIRFSEIESDRALFKVPTLRNLGFTAPYMHDGSISSIEEVVDHYSEGIQQHIHLSAKLKPLDFSKEEKSQLIAFLHTLNDSLFVQATRFKQLNKR